MNWTNFHKQFQTANAITGDWYKEADNMSFPPGGPPLVPAGMMHTGYAYAPVGKFNYFYILSD